MDGMKKGEEFEKTESRGKQVEKIFDTWRENPKRNPQKNPEITKKILKSRRKSQKLKYFWQNFRTSFSLGLNTIDWLI